MGLVRGGYDWGSGYDRLAGLYDRIARGYDRLAGYMIGLHAGYDRSRKVI